MLVRLMATATVAIITALDQSEHDEQEREEQFHQIRIASPSCGTGLLQKDTEPATAAPIIAAAAMAPAPSTPRFKISRPAAGLSASPELRL